MQLFCLTLVILFSNIYAKLTDKLNEVFNCLFGAKIYQLYIEDRAYMTADKSQAIYSLKFLAKIKFFIR